MISLDQTNTIFRKIQQESDNNKCFQCNQIARDWASVNNAIFLCIKCAGIHRSLGMNFSFVRSISMDSWTSKQLQIMKRGGNNRFRLFLQDFGIPSDSAPNFKYKTKAAQYYRQKVKIIYKLRCQAQGINYPQPPTYQQGRQIIKIEFLQQKQQFNDQRSSNVNQKIQLKKNQDFIDQAKEIIILGARKTKTFAINTFQKIENKYQQTDFKQIGRKTKQASKNVFNKAKNGIKFLWSKIKKINQKQ